MKKLLMFFFLCLSFKNTFSAAFHHYPESPQQEFPFEVNKSYLFFSPINDAEFWFFFATLKEKSDPIFNWAIAIYDSVYQPDEVMQEVLDSLDRDDIVTSDIETHGGSLKGFKLTSPNGANYLTFTKGGVLQKFISLAHSIQWQGFLEEVKKDPSLIPLEIIGSDYSFLDKEVSKSDEFPLLIKEDGILKNKTAQLYRKGLSPIDYKFKVHAHSFLPEIGFTKTFSKIDGSFNFNSHKFQKHAVRAMLLNEPIEKEGLKIWRTFEPQIGGFYYYVIEDAKSRKTFYAWSKEDGINSIDGFPEKLEQLHKLEQ